MAKKFRICVVTGSRAEFGIWRPVLQAIQASARLELKLVVTGMHLLPEFGSTERSVYAAGNRADARVPMYRRGELAPRSLARGILGLAEAFRELKAGLVLLLGDRLEMLAAANAALAERIPMGHIHGGETAPGIWDEQIRHAITKMSHLHFCATKMARQRILRMGEPPESVFQVGAPALDWAVHESKVIDGMLQKVARPVRPLILMHPSSASASLEFKRTKRLLNIVRRIFHSSSENPVTAIGSNNDPGHEGISRAYQDDPTVRIVASASQDLYWQVLRQCGMLIGNSSSGIIEAASFGVPVVNIGQRQAGRERNGNVIDVGWDAGEISQAISKAMHDKSFLRRVAQRKNVYGDGKASGRIVKVLEAIARNGISLEKRFV